LRPESSCQGGCSQNFALHRLGDLLKGCLCTQVKSVNGKGVNGELIAVRFALRRLWSTVADTVKVVSSLLHLRAIDLRLRLLGHIFWQP